MVKQKIQQSRVLKELMTFERTKDGKQGLNHDE